MEKDISHTYDTTEHQNHLLRNFKSCASPSSCVLTPEFQKLCLGWGIGLCPHINYNEIYTIIHIINNTEIYTIIIYTIIINNTEIYIIIIYTIIINNTEIKLIIIYTIIINNTEIYIIIIYTIIINNTEIKLININIIDDIFNKSYNK